MMEVAWTWTRGRRAREVETKVMMTSQRTRDVVETKVRKLRLARVRRHQMETKDYAPEFSEVRRNLQLWKLLNIDAHIFLTDRGAELAS